MRVALTLEPCWGRVPGGTATAAAGLAGALLHHGGVEAVGVAASHRQPPVVDVPIAVHHLPLPTVLLYEAWHRFRRPVVERATGSVAVVHGTGGAAPAHRAPLIMTVYDLAWHHEPDHYTPRGVAFHRRALELGIDEAAILVCPSQCVGADLVAMGVESDRVRVVPLGVAVRTGDPARARAELDLPPSFLLFVGTREPRKNLPRLLDAVASLGAEAPPLVLVGPHGWGPDITEQLASMPVPPRELGFVAAARLHDLYAAATVVCYPSLREGFGLPVLEAMAQGTPVVTSAGTATEEVAGDAGVLVDPLDTGSIAHAIADLLDDPERSARLGELGRRRAGELTWERCASAHVEIYREVAG